MKSQARQSVSLSQKNELQSEWSLEYRERIFYVFFTESDHILTPTLKKGFSHCYVIEQLEYIYMMFDPTRFGLNVVLPNCDAKHSLVENMMMLDQNLKVLKIITKGDGESLILKPKLLSCVSTIEYIMGVCFRFCLTPYQLYKKLKTARHPNILSVRELSWPEAEKKPSVQNRGRYSQPNRTGLRDFHLSSD